MSAIKRTLIDYDYDWQDKRLLLGTLTKGCRVMNDQFRTRLPIYKGLLETLLFEIEQKFLNQPYLETMFKAFFLISYYGMFRVGELASGDHPVRAKDVYISTNKDKILFILYTSKTHDRAMPPQKIKIKANKPVNINQKIFCPFKASREYCAIRSDIRHEDDPFFVYCDGRTPVSPMHVTKVLRDSLESINLDPRLYCTHSLRLGRTQDMLKYGYTTEQIQLAGHWRSNAAYKYIRQCF